MVDRNLSVARQYSIIMFIKSFLKFCRSTLGLSCLDPAEVTRALDVPEGWELSAYLCLGHAEFMDDTPLLHRVGWQENFPTKWDVR